MIILFYRAFCLKPAFPLTLLQAQNCVELFAQKPKECLYKTMNAASLLVRSKDILCVHQAIKMDLAASGLTYILPALI